MADAPKNIGHIAENVIALGGQFQSIMDMAQALKGMTSIEQAITERQQALAKASADHDAAVAQLKIVQDQGTKLKAEQEVASRLHDKTLNDKTALMVKEAGDKAAAILKKAQDAADALTADTAAEAARIKTASDVALAAANKRLTAATDASSNMEAKLFAMQSDHATLAKKMAALKLDAQRLAS